VRFLYDRLHTYDLQENHYKTEVTTIQNILHNNAFPIPTPNPHTPSGNLKKQSQPTHTQNPTPKWATFTYIGKETTFITNLFKKSNVKIAFRTNNTIQKLLIHKQHRTDTHSQPGVYKLTCPDCGKAYVGQTGRNFTTRFKEHKKNTRTPSGQETYHLTSQST
jgi:hypothetical protein